MQIDSEDDVSATRAYTPYGDVRSETGDLATERGFLGQIEDPMGLSYLNARYYDTTNGIFISPDPLYDTGRPRSQNPYAYAHGNPTTLSDPSGLRIPVSNDNSAAIGYDHRINGGRGGFIGQAGADTGISRSLARRITAVQTRQRNEYRRTVVATANRTRRHRAMREMKAMCEANCDPGFWHALAAAGSGGNLTLIAMCIENCEPGFWRFMHGVRSVATAQQIAEWVESGRRGNAAAPEFAGADWEVIERFMGPSPSGGCGADEVAEAFVQASGCYAPNSGNHDVPGGPISWIRGRWNDHTTNAGACGVMVCIVGYTYRDADGQRHWRGGIQVAITFSGAFAGTSSGTPGDVPAATVQGGALVCIGKSSGSDGFNYSVGTSRCPGIFSGP